MTDTSKIPMGKLEITLKDSTGGSMGLEIEIYDEIIKETYYAMAGESTLHQTMVIHALLGQIIEFNDQCLTKKIGPA